MKNCNCEGRESIGLCHYKEDSVGNIVFENNSNFISEDDGQITFNFSDKDLFEKAYLDYWKPQAFKFTKTRNVKSPTRGSEKSAGIDFYIPNDYTGKMILGPGERVLIPSGIKVKLPPNMALMFVNKSGVASKRGLDVLACLVDEDYSQEVHINLVNTGKDAVIIEAGEKIVQGILIPAYYFKIDELSNSEYESSFEKTSRTGGFGSTGTR